jgi:hypothetical protein
MATAFSAFNAQEFVNNHLDLPIKGDLSHTLSNYVNTHVPAWGVIVNPALGVDVLVWYDYANNLHVIDDVNGTVATSIAAPAYHTADESLLYNLAENTLRTASGIGNWLSQIPGAIPSPQTLMTVAMVGIAIYILTLLPKRKA